MDDNFLKEDDQGPVRGRAFGAVGQERGTGSHKIIALHRRFAARGKLRLTIMEPSRIARSAKMRSDKSVRHTRKNATATLILFFSPACAAEPSLLTSISGLWQFEDKNVWIQIDEKGAAYQCRIGREGTVFSASGIFVSPNSIEWQNIWGTDTVTLTSGTMTLKGRFGEFKHHRSSKPISPACLPMRQRGGVPV
jgi:hypothetical protein